MHRERILHTFLQLHRLCILLESRSVIARISALVACCQTRTAETGRYVRYSRRLDKAVAMKLRSMVHLDKQRGHEN